MPRTSATLIALLLLTIINLAHVLSAGEQKPQRLETDARVTMNYLLYLPNNNPKLYDWLLSHRRAKD